MPASDLASNIIDGVIAAAAVVALFFSVLTLRDSQETSKEARKQADSTANLAESAAAQLKEAQKQAESTVNLAENAAAQLKHQEQALSASIQPAVIDVGQDLLKLGREGPALDPARDVSVIEQPTSLGPMIVITVPVRNVGSGPAFINSTRIWVQREITIVDGKKVATGDEIDATVAQRVLNAGEAMHVIATALPTTAADEVLRTVIEDSANFMLYIRYTDLAGERRIRSELLIHAVSYQPGGDPTKTDSRYMPLRIRLHECGLDWEPIGKPFVYSGGIEDRDEYFVTTRVLKSSGGPASDVR